MLLPGLASARIPVRIRLLAAMMISIACAPLAMSNIVSPTVKNSDFQNLFPILLTELLYGAILGMTCRIFFSSIQFAMAAIAAMIGLSATFTQSFENDEPSSSITEIIAATAVVVFFATGQHSEIIVLLVDSYSFHPMGSFFNSASAVDELQTVVALSMNLALRISSPFIIYSFFVNFSLGLINKMIPQIPVQFVGAPLLLGGGLFILHLLSGSFVDIYTNEFSMWLEAR